MSSIASICGSMKDSTTYSNKGIKSADSICCQHFVLIFKTNILPGVPFLQNTTGLEKTYTLVLNPDASLVDSGSSGLVVTR